MEIREIRENRPYNDIIIGGNKEKYVLWTKDEFINSNYFQIGSFFCNHELAVFIETDKLKVWFGNSRFDLVVKYLSKHKEEDIKIYENRSIEKYYALIPKESKLYDYFIVKLYKYHLRETIEESDYLMKILELGEEMTLTDFLISGVKTGKFKWNGMENESDLKNAGLIC